MAGLFFGVRPVQGGRQQGQRHVPVPAVRAAHLVVSQVRLLPGRLEGVLDGSAVPGHAHQGLQVAALRREACQSSASVQERRNSR